MDPKSAFSKDGPLDPNRANRATPKANDAVVMTPDSGVGSEPASLGYGVDCQRGCDSPQPRAEDVELRGEELHSGKAPEDRMGKPVTDVAHAAQHDVHADKAEQRPGEPRDEEALQEEGVSQRLEYRLHQASTCDARSTRSPPSSTTTRIPRCSRTSMRAP